MEYNKSLGITKEDFYKIKYNHDFSLFFMISSFILSIFFIACIVGIISYQQIIYSPYFIIYLSCYIAGICVIPIFFICVILLEILLVKKRYIFSKEIDNLNKSKPCE